MANELKDIISRLEKQKAAIDRALLALREMDDSGETETTTVRRGRPKKTVTKNVVKRAATRTISDDGRKRIAEAQRKRWAAKKRTASKKQAGTKKATKAVS
jgi:hypothetical protein